MISLGLYLQGEYNLTEGKGWQRKRRAGWREGTWYTSNKYQPKHPMSLTSQIRTIFSKILEVVQGFSVGYLIDSDASRPYVLNHQFSLSVPKGRYLRRTTGIEVPGVKYVPYLTVCSMEHTVRTL